MNDRAGFSEKANLHGGEWRKGNGGKHNAWSVWRRAATASGVCKMSTWINKCRRRKIVFTWALEFTNRAVRITVELNKRQLIWGRIGGYVTSGTRNAIKESAVLHLKIQHHISHYMSLTIISKWMGKTGFLWLYEKLFSEISERKTKATPTNLKKKSDSHVV